MHGKRAGTIGNCAFNRLDIAEAVFMDIVKQAGKCDWDASTAKALFLGESAANTNEKMPCRARYRGAALSFSLPAKTCSFRKPWPARYSRKCSNGSRLSGCIRSFIPGRSRIVSASNPAFASRKPVSR